MAGSQHPAVPGPAPADPSNRPADPLTRIHAAYTLSTTQEGGGGVEALMVKDFLNALAEVALAVAARESKKAKR